MDLVDLIYERDLTFRGDPMETGGTSIRNPVGKPFMSFVSKWPKGVKTALDYGSGQIARHSIKLREMGIQCYAYDPFHGKSSGDGWNTTTNVLPTEKFDFAFSAFVLNVVPDHVENEIIANCKKLGKNSGHITRGGSGDIHPTIKSNLEKSGSNILKDFVLQYFTQGDQELIEKIKQGDISKSLLEEIGFFGVQTTKGFQRVPQLDKKGFKKSKAGSALIFM